MGGGCQLLSTASVYVILLESDIGFFYTLSIAHLPLVLIGALLPDIDLPQSTVGRRVILLSKPINLIFGHRGAFHSVVACVACYGLFSIIDDVVALAVTFGYVSHLVGDMATKAGTNLIWPITKTRYRLPILFARNSLFEYLSTALLTCYAFITVFGGSR